MEHWKEIPGWGHLYEVSSLGRVRSKDKYVRAAHNSVAIRRGRVLTPVIKHRGYRAVTLADGEVREQHFIHALVLAAFVGPRPDNQVARHIDDDRDNNTLANLAYGTQVENNADALRNKVKPVGERHGRAVLTEKEVIAIRASKAHPAALSAVYGVTEGHIKAIRSRRVWRHL